MSITEADIVKILDKIDTALATIAKLRGQLAAIITERDNALRKYNMAFEAQFAIARERDGLKRQIVALNQQIEALKDAAR